MGADISRKAIAVHVPVAARLDAMKTAMERVKGRQVTYSEVIEVLLEAYDRAREETTA